MGAGLEAGGQGTEAASSLVGSWVSKTSLHGSPRSKGSLDLPEDLLLHRKRFAMLRAASLEQRRKKRRYGRGGEGPLRGQPSLLFLCAAPAANAVLFCGTCDEPHRQRRFFHRLLCAESEWPWFDMRGREEREALRGGPCKRPSGAPLRLASRREEYSALSRIGYKLLPHEGDSLERPPGAGNVRSPLDASGLAVQISDSLRSPEICTQAPPLLRFLTELPEALNTPPGLLMLLQPSRWLRPIERLGPCKLLALQQLTDKKRFGLFLSLVVRAAAAAAPRSTSAAASSEGGEGPSSSSSGRGPPPGEGRSHRSVPGRAVVAEAFLCCSRCCWRCGGLQRVTARGTVALCCCLEQSEWLSMLRSRFAYILLLFYGVLGPFEGLDGDVRAGSSADPSVPSGSAALMVADISHAGTETG
ncbi:hypothetical protein cyc_07165 [Cyclospora cayetanensis]|uniref:Uncharacterized protein n=1 Tax=Cyclospora cayetanensis TaxID=88456 RepID=A0A1D3CUC9_9EIME|nr:hypothetical protein cyc_07165 [Cyclospora cayetanensis]